MAAQEFSIVTKACLKNLQDAVVAVKSVCKGNPNNPANIPQEIELLAACDHPNILEFIESFEDSAYYHIVTEYCDLGNASNYFLQWKQPSELLVAHWLNSAIAALEYLHKRRVVHLDIKPSNFLVKSCGTSIVFKLADFGLARSVGNWQEPAGTWPFMAPEQTTGTCTEKSDIWALGISLYYVFRGQTPCDKPSAAGISNSQSDNANCCCEEWDSIPHEAQELIRLMIAEVPSERLTLQQIRSHPWLARHLSKLPRT